MYIVVDRSKLVGKYFGIINTIPDGRAYIPIGEIRNVGTLHNVDIIGSARELKELIEKQKEEGIKPPVIDPGFTHPEYEEDVAPGFSVIPKDDEEEDKHDTEEGDEEIKVPSEDPQEEEEEKKEEDISKEPAKGGNK